MANAKIDDNREKTSLATDSNGTVKNLLVDPSTDRLLIEVFIKDNGTHLLNRQKIDDNRERVSICVDDNDDIRPLLIDSRNGLLLVDLICE